MIKRGDRVRILKPGYEGCSGKISKVHDFETKAYIVSLDHKMGVFVFYENEVILESLYE